MWRRGGRDDWLGYLVLSKAISDAVQVPGTSTVWVFPGKPTRLDFTGVTDDREPKKADLVSQIARVLANNMESLSHDFCFSGNSRIREMQPAVNYRGKPNSSGDTGLRYPGQKDRLWVMRSASLRPA